MKTTKRALFSSVIALILCFSMLVGTTFAWFTDSVESGVNKIIAGNLDIELYHEDNQVTNTYDKLFKGIKWEPGVVAYENITVANEGTLALKYQLGINFTDATTNANGDTLAKVLKVGFVKGGIQSGTREGALDEVSAWLPLESFVQSGKLLPENYNGDPVIGASQVSDTYGIVIYWQPSDIDNEFNMNNENRGKVMSINLGIKLLATQLEAEDDSFDETYDEDAWHPDMFVTTAAELAKAIEEVKDGGIIALSESLTFDKDSATNSGGTWYEGLYYVGDKSFTLDLNGKTITNDSAVNDYLMLFKNDGEKASTITIKNGTLEAASSAYCALCTSTTSTQKITINLENVNLIGNNSNGAVAKIRGGAELNVKAGTVITGKNSYVGIEAVGNDTVVNFYDGAKIYQNGTGSYVGSLIGVSYNATANVYDGYGKSAQGGFIAMTSGGTINVSGGEWIAKNDGTYANGNASVLIAQSDKATYNGGNSVINVTGGTFKGGYNCYGNAAGDAQINISAGTFNADPSEYVAAGYKAVAADGAYYVVADNVAGVVTKPETLKDALSAAGAAGAGNTTIAFFGNIDMSGTAWTPIKVDGYHGADIVTIEGNGATITGLTAPLFAGGFAGGSGIVIKDLTIADSNIVSTNTIGSGAFIESVDSMTLITLDNCHLVNSTVTGGSGSRTGGLIGWTAGYNNVNDGPVKTYVNITNCSVIDCTITCDGSVGGIYGHAGNNAWTYSTIENCTVKNCKLNSTDDGGWRVGVVVGTANVGEVTISNITESGNTLTQTGKTAPAGQSNLYGRFVPGTTGKLVIDGAEVVATTEALKEVLSSEAENISVILANDISIDISTGWKMGSANTKSITIDGNGKKLTLSNTYRSYFNLANAEGVLNLKNMTLTNTHKGTHFFDYTTHFNCDVVAENVVFAKSPLVSDGATAVFNDCAFSQAGTDIYGLWIMSGTNVTVNGGELTTDRGFKISDEDSAQEKTVLKVTETKFNNTKKAAILVTTNYGAEITLSNLDITDCGADSTNAVWIDDGRTATFDEIKVTGGTKVIEH